MISHTEDVDNTAFTDRHRGVTRIFENAIYYRDFDELKAKVSEHLSLHEGNTPIVLGMCLQGSVLDSLNEFLEQQTSLIYYLGVTDITSSILSQLNDPTTSLVAVSGFPPITQGNLVSAALLNKVYGIFGGDISLLKKYTPIVPTR